MDQERLIRKTERLISDLQKEFDALQPITCPHLLCDICQAENVRRLQEQERLSIKIQTCFDFINTVNNLAKGE